jgi:polar amino acid transport system substrate-binding protein
MRVARSFTVLLVMVGLMAGYVQTAVAADAAKVTKVAPVLDRIMAKKELIVGTAASMPPLNMTMKDGQVIGMEIDIARLIADSLEVKLTLKTMPFNELLPALEAGRIDIVLSGMTITPVRNLKVAFAGPYFSSGKSMLVKEANAEALSDTVKINNPDKVLVALKGSTSQIFVEKVFPKAKLLLTEDYDQAVTMVREGKAQAMVADQAICQVSVYRYPDAGLAALKKTLTYEPIGIAVPANDFLFLNLLQNFITGMVNSGDIRTLSDRWFKDGAWVSQLR